MCQDSVQRGEPISRQAHISEADPAIFRAIGLKKEPQEAKPLKEISISSTELETIHSKLMRMHALMLQDGEENFSKGVAQAAQNLQESIENPENKTQAYRKAEDTFLSMWGGMGSLGDFYIANAPKDQEKALQEEYQNIANTLYKFFQQHK